MAVADIASTKVADVYAEVCDALLEDGGLQLGILTEANFLEILVSVYLQFCALSGINKRATNIRAIAGQQTYTYPDWMTQVTDVEYDQRGLQETDSQSVELSRYGFEYGTRREPECWIRDLLGVKQIKIFPAPRTSGAALDTPVRNLRVWGVEIPLDDEINMDSELDLVPNMLTPYLKWGCLERIHLIDGELRDANKAMYCRARWTEGLNLCRAITGQGAVDA